MKSVQQKKADELRMSSTEFDRIMRGALQTQPEEAPKKKNGEGKNGAQEKRC